MLARDSGFVDAADDLTALVAEALEVLERDGPAALDAFAARHPERSEALRERIRTLQESGLVGEPPRAGDVLGGYRLGEWLGEGGMGVVHVAEELASGRRVALKTLRGEHLGQPRARERFQREMRAAARMRHPGIVALQDVGEDCGRPYLVMELLEGRTLDEVLRAVADRPPDSLDGADLWAEGPWPRACLELVRQVAHALEHAHRRGVLHRDVKPSNVFVTRDGTPRLLDFGLAHVAEASSLTRTGAHLGSLPYMAPEQVRGEPLDERADVYSLGVTLYELLALRTPFEAATSAGVVERILDGRPPSLRAFNRNVTRAVETVCRTAMDVEPAARYASARAFAEDLERLLDGRPILARDPSPWRRARRWIRRRPAATAALALGILVALGGPLGFALQQRAARRHIEAERNRALAEARTANELAGFLADHFFAIDPLEAQGHEPTLLEVLERTARSLNAAFPDDPAVRARLLEQAGAAFTNLARYDLAEELYRQRLELRRAGLGGPAELASALRDLGWVRHMRGDLEGAEPLLREALELQVSSGGNALELATTRNDYAQHLVVRGLLDEAEALYHAALDTFERERGPDHDDTVMVLMNLANLERVRGRYAEAETLLRRVLEVRTRVLGERHPHVLESLLALAGVLLDQNEEDEAEPFATRAVELGRDLYPRGHEDLANALDTLGTIVRRRGNPARAEVLAREALAMLRELYGENHLRVAYQMEKVALAVADQSRVDEAIPLLRQSLEMQRAIHGESDVDSAFTEYSLAGLLARAGRNEEALVAYRGALESYEALGPQHPSLHVALSALAHHLLAMGRPGEALPLLQRLLEIAPASPRVQKARVSVGECLLELGRLEEAGAALEDVRRELEAQAPNSELAKRATGLVERLDMESAGETASTGD